MEAWRYFLKGTTVKFKIWTDHKNLEDAILDLHRRQLAEQLLRTTQEQRRVEGERQRQVEINQIMEEWRNEDVDALDYEGQCKGHA